MADYWKSQPRKFCEFCKCWIADNKSSRDFHEKGKRHQENVKKKIDDLRKKGVKDAEKEAEMTDSLMAMEKAAMAALKKDLAANPDMAAQYGLKVKTEDTEKKQTSEDTATEPATEPVTEPVSTEPSDPGPVDINLEYWHEATNPEGYVYYWNSSTGESVWEKPKGYVGDSERAQEMVAAVAGTTSEKAESTAMKPAKKMKAKVKPTPRFSEKRPQPQARPQARPTGTRDGSFAGTSEVKAKSASSFKGKGSKGKGASTNPQAAKQSIGPQLQQAPYGSWEQIPEDVPEEKQDDLELPVVESKVTEEIKVITLEKPKIKFREKKVDTLGAEFVAFKKRKMAAGQRSIKQREKDT